MLLLGVLAAQAEAAVAVASDYDLLETEITSTTVGSVTLTGLVSAYSADYQHLQLRITARTTSSSPSRTVAMRLGDTGGVDSGANYANHLLFGNGSTVVSDAASSVNQIELGNLASHSSIPNERGAAVIDILDPFSSSKYTTIRSLSGEENLGRVYLSSGLWMDTAQVDRISIGCGGSFNLSFASDTRISLYGLKAA